MENPIGAGQNVPDDKRASEPETSVSVRRWKALVLVLCWELRHRNAKGNNRKIEYTKYLFGCWRGKNEPNETRLARIPLKVIYLFVFRCRFYLFSFSFQFRCCCCCCFCSTVSSALAPQMLPLSNSFYFSIEPWKFYCLFPCFWRLSVFLWLRRNSI